MAITFLSRKLRIVPGQTMLIINAPESYFTLLGKLPDNKIETIIVSGHYDFVHLFVKDSVDLKLLVSTIINLIGEDTLFWISYPKQSSKIKTDLNRDIGWEPLFLAGFRPVSAVAIDMDWTALRFRKGSFNRQKSTDESPRLIVVPSDFSAALAAKPAAQKVFDQFAYTYRKEYVNWIESAKKADTRQRRISRAVENISAGKKLI
jgi:hypothetical protein